MLGAMVVFGLWANALWAAGVSAAGAPERNRTRGGLTHFKN